MGIQRRRMNERLELLWTLLDTLTMRRRDWLWGMNGSRELYWTLLDNLTIRRRDWLWGMNGSRELYWTLWTTGCKTGCEEWMEELMRIICEFSGTGAENCTGLCWTLRATGCETGCEECMGVWSIDKVNSKNVSKSSNFKWKFCQNIYRSSEMSLSLFWMHFNGLNEKPHFFTNFLWLNLSLLIQIQCIIQKRDKAIERGIRPFRSR